MAKQIIILDTDPSDGGNNTIRAVFWFAVAVNRRVPRPDITVSAWASASAPEMAALQDGSVLEEVVIRSFPTSTSNASIKAIMVAAYTDRLAYLNALPFKLQFNGVFYDGATWSA